MLQEIFNMVYGVLSDVDFIGRFRVTMVEVSAVDSSIYIFHRCNSIINRTLKKKSMFSVDPKLQLGPYKPIKISLGSI